METPEGRARVKQQLVLKSSGNGWVTGRQYSASLGTELITWDLDLPDDSTCLRLKPLYC